MNFIIDLSLNKYKSIIYNAISVIINRFTKTIKYLFVNIIIDIAQLTKIFYFEILYYYNILNNIINNRDFILINNF